MVKTQRVGSKLLGWVVKNKVYLFLAAILLLGGYLRLWRIQDYMTFLGDEGRDVLAVKRMLVEHDIPFIGPTASVGGFFLGPIYYYFMAPFLLLFGLNPIGPAVMVGLCGVVTIFLIFLLGKKFFNPETGLTAALLYSLSPVIINYSHSSWNPNVVPFFALLLVYFLLNIYERNKPRDFFWTGLTLGIGIQLHYLFSFLFIVTFFNLFINRKKINRQNLILLFAGILIPLTPFLLFEIKHEFLNIKLLLDFIFASQDTGFSLSFFFKNLIDVAVRLFVRLVTQNNNFLGMLLMWLSLAAIVIKRKQLNKNNLLLFLSWALIPILLFGLYKREIHDYYLGIIYPVPFLLTAFFLTNLWKNKVKLLFSSAILLFLFKINWDARPFIYEPNRQLKQAQTITDFILDKAMGKPFNFALITGQNSDQAYRYFFEINNNPAVIIENAQKDPQRSSVTNQLLIVCEIQCEPLGNSLWEVAGFGRAEIAGEWDVSVVKVYRLTHYKGK